MIIGMYVNLSNHYCCLHLSFMWILGLCVKEGVQKIWNEKAWRRACVVVDELLAQLKLIVLLI